MKEIIKSDLDRFERFLDKKITRRDALMWGFLSGIILFEGIRITRTLSESIKDLQDESKEVPTQQPQVPEITTPSKTE